MIDKLGLEKDRLQEMRSSENYLPDFEYEGDPFNSVVSNPRRRSLLSVLPFTLGKAKLNFLAVRLILLIYILNEGF